MELNRASSRTSNRSSMHRFAFSRSKVGAKENNNFKWGNVACTTLQRTWDQYHKLVTCPSWRAGIRRTCHSCVVSISTPPHQHNLSLSIQGTSQRHKFRALLFLLLAQWLSAGGALRGLWVWSPATWYYGLDPEHWWKIWHPNEGWGSVNSKYASVFSLFFEIGFVKRHSLGGSLVVRSLPSIYESLVWNSQHWQKRYLLKAYKGFLCCYLFLQHSYLPVTKWHESSHRHYASGLNGHIETVYIPGMVAKQLRKKGYLFCTD